VQFIRPRQVLEMIGVSRMTLWRMVQAGTFPPPVRITERNRGYVREAVEAWMKERADERHRGPVAVLSLNTHGAEPIGRQEAPARRRRAG
jgi:prophage regulatory protein